MTSATNEKASWLSEAAPEELRRIVDALYRVHRLVSAITDLDVLLERILEESKQVAQAEACSLLLYDPDNDELYFRVALGEEGDLQTLKREIRLKLGQGIAGTAAATRECVNVVDVKTDERFYDFADKRSKFQTRNLLAIPLIDRDELIGVIEVVNKVGGPHFTNIDLRVMQMFSALTASALANAHLIEENLRAERLAALGQAVAGMSVAFVRRIRMRSIFIGHGNKCHDPAVAVTEGESIFAEAASRHTQNKRAITSFGFWYSWRRLQERLKPTDGGTTLAVAPRGHQRRCQHAKSHVRHVARDGNALATARGVGY